MDCKDKDLSLKKENMDQVQISCNCGDVFVVAFVCCCFFGDIGMLLCNSSLK